MGRKKNSSLTPAATDASARPDYPIPEEEIRQRAFELFILRAGGPGDAASDWLRAEAELRQISHRGASFSPRADLPSVPPDSQRAAFNPHPAGAPSGSRPAVVPADARPVSQSQPPTPTKRKRP